MTSKKNQVPRSDEPELIARVLEVQAEERERIARELHDETGQSLTALLVGLRMLEESVNDEVRAQVTVLREHVRDLIENVGRLARGLHPPTLGELSLAAVIEQQVSDFSASSEILGEVDIDEPEILDQLSRPAALAVYRIVQEGLTNVWRHADAEHVGVCVQRLDPHLRIEVRDDGNGLAHREFDGRGLGIRLMKRRLESLGGDLTVDATVGKGTVLRAELPLPSFTQ
jgi:signal transduction histidine kinase